MARTSYFCNLRAIKTLWNETSSLKNVQYDTYKNTTSVQTSATPLFTIIKYSTSSFLSKIQMNKVMLETLNDLFIAIMKILSNKLHN